MPDERKPPPHDPSDPVAVDVLQPEHELRASAERRLLEHALGIERRIRGDDDVGLEAADEPGQLLANLDFLLPPPEEGILGKGLAVAHRHDRKARRVVIADNEVAPWGLETGRKRMRDHVAASREVAGQLHLNWMAGVITHQDAQPHHALPILLHVRTRIPAEWRVASSA